ncbi:hypothetical protein EVAR_101855_1 [Eumeta japonica]|uniref:Uncharacterized protein n=1 Tax=Eumeta variegata TaxID=151549 RepID=A0A4C1SNH0_EUMVA|nr:hypothetical protein EVAR_101855_1 [Eumeta japonica]
MAPKRWKEKLWKTVYKMGRRHQNDCWPKVGTDNSGQTTVEIVGGGLCQEYRFKAGWGFNEENTHTSLITVKRDGGRRRADQNFVSELRAEQRACFLVSGCKQIDLLRAALVYNSAVRRTWPPSRVCASRYAWPMRVTAAQGGCISAVNIPPPVGACDDYASVGRTARHAVGRLSP